MKKNELVWRELVDAAVMQGRRLWGNIDDLAFRAGVPAATAWYALRRPVEIGAVQQHHAGFTVVNPEKVLTLLCAARSITADAHAVISGRTEELQRFTFSSDGTTLVVGGSAAAVALLGGVNTVSDYSVHLYYLRDASAVTAFDAALQQLDISHQAEPGGGQDRKRHRNDLERMVFLRADPRAARTWQLHTSFAQTYADLFATPGWQASEFRLALQEKFISKRDWDQESA